MLTLSLRERDRLSVLRQVDAGLISARRGAELLDLSLRQLRRLRRRFEREGDAAVIHALRGRPPNNAKPPELKAYALERASEAVFRDFGPTLLAEHLSGDPEVGALDAHTLRRWMIAAGLWKVRRRGARHRKARPRRAAVGELTQWDSSEHAWFEDRYPGRCCLIQMHDDATNRLLMGRFVPKDDGAANRGIALDYLRRWGRPVAFYTDKAGHFGRRTRPVSSIPLAERDAKLTESVIRRALRELNVELILANSPQAKGRVERNFATSQDRLVKELRVRGISSLEEGNRFLEEVYVPYWNERFAVDPGEPKDLHRPLPKRVDLERLFAETRTRTISNTFTIRYDHEELQIPKQQARGVRPGQQLTVELRLDGSTRFRWKNRYLDLEPVRRFAKTPPRNAPARKVRPKVSTPATAQIKGHTRPPPPKPGPDHPWRRKGTFAAKSRVSPRLPSTPAASRPAPSSPHAP
jgi:hypothetical protein